MSLEVLFAHLKAQKAGDARQDPAHPVAELPVLRAAAAALGAAPAVNTTAATQPPPAGIQRDAPVSPELSGAIELLAAALLAPPEDLFADLGGAPRAPESDPAAYWEATALRLRLLCALLPRLGPIDLEGIGSSSGSGGAKGSERRGEAEESLRRRRADDYSKRAAPVVGIVEVVDEDEEGADGGASFAALKSRQQRAQLAAAAFEVVALYADAGTSSSGSSINSSSSSGGTGESSQGTAAPSPSEAAAGNSSVQPPTGIAPAIVRSPALLSLIQDTWRRSQALPTPWGHPQTAALSAELLVALERAVRAEGAPALPAAAGGDSSGAEKAVAVDPLLSGRVVAAAAEQWLVPRLRDTLFAPHRHAQAQERGSSEAYTGPATFPRALAARKLAWAALSISPTALDPSLLGTLLPAALAASDDAAPAVSRFGAVALAALARAAPRGALAPQRELLLGRVRRLVVGCEGSAWGTALPAAVDIVQALEPPNDPRAEGYHSLLKELLTEAERTAHKRPQALVFLACLGALLPRTRLYTARHLSRLSPLLLEWTLAPDDAARRAALGTLEAVLRACWPRAGAHGAVIWRHLLAAARSADALSWRPQSLAPADGDKAASGGGSAANGGGGQGAKEGTAEALASVGRLLIALCGRDALAAAEGAESDGAAVAGGAAGGNGGQGACEAALRALML